jgi:WD40 repeat protein
VASEAEEMEGQLAAIKAKVRVAKLEQKAERLRAAEKKVKTAPPVPFVVTLTGHSGAVNAVAVLDGTNGSDLVASGSDDCTVKLWNPWTHTCEETLIGHTEAVTCLAVGKRSTAESGGQFVVSGSRDTKDQLRIWSKDSASGDWKHRDARDTLGNHEDGPVECVAVTQNQKEEDMVVSGNDVGTITFWDLSEGKVGTLKTGNNIIGYVLPLHANDSTQFTNSAAEMKILATGVQLWQIGNQKYKPESIGHSAAVLSVLSEEKSTKKLIDHVVTGHDGDLKIWDSVTWQCVATLKHGNKAIKSVAVLNAPVQALSNLPVKELWIRAKANRATNKQLEVAADSKDPKRELVQLVATLETTPGESAQGTAMLVQALSDLSVKELGIRAKANRATIKQLEVAADSKDPKHELAQLVATLETTPGGSAQGTAMLVSGSDDHSLKIWDPQAQTCASTLIGHTAPVNCIAVLKDLREDPKRVVPMGKDIVISGSSDHTVKLWNVWAEQVAVREADDAKQSSVAVLTDERGNAIVASGNVKGGLSTWTLNTSSKGVKLEAGGPVQGHTVCTAVVDDALLVAGGVGSMTKTSTNNISRKNREQEESKRQSYVRERKKEIAEAEKHEDEKKKSLEEAKAGVDNANAEKTDRDSRKVGTPKKTPAKGSGDADASHADVGAGVDSSADAEENEEAKTEEEILLETALSLWTEEENGHGLQEKLGLPSAIKYTGQKKAYTILNTHCNGLRQEINSEKDELRNNLNEKEKQAASKMMKDSKSLSAKDFKSANRNKKKETAEEAQKRQNNEIITFIVKFKYWLEKHVEPAEPDAGTVQAKDNAINTTMKLRLMQLRGGGDTDAASEAENKKREKDAALKQYVDTKIEDNVKKAVAEDINNWWLNEFHKVKIFVASSGKCLAESDGNEDTGHTDTVTTVMVMAKRDSEIMLLSGSKDTTMKLWSITAEALQLQRLQLQGAITAEAPKPNQLTSAYTLAGPCALCGGAAYRRQRPCCGEWQCRQHREALGTIGNR